MTYLNQKHKKKYSFSGIALHSGVNVKVCLNPLNQILVLFSKR